MASCLQLLQAACQPNCMDWGLTWVHIDGMVCCICSHGNCSPLGADTRQRCKPHTSPAQQGFRARPVPSLLKIGVSAGMRRSQAGPQLALNVQLAQGGGLMYSVPWLACMTGLHAEQSLNCCRLSLRSDINLHVA